MTKTSMFVIFQLCLTLAVLIHAQDQSGFISIDCGVVEGSSYNDETTKITYTSDANIIDSGESYTISSQYNSSSLQRQFWNVRSFPQPQSPQRNCYTFKIPRTNSEIRLVRARFMYGNYDTTNSLPTFDLYIGPNRWDSVEFENAASVVTKEMVLVASSDYVHVCLVNTNGGVPFISTLEIRVLQNDTYMYQSQTFQLLERFDVGLQEDQVVRSIIEISLTSTDSSALPPLLNAFEVFKERPFNLSQTDQNDVDAIMQIKSTYAIRRNWQGDPCSPESYTWNGLNCSYYGLNQPRITSLNLSSSGLTGNISSYISNLKFIQYLDLSNNSLTGPVPDSLSQLDFLTTLNLEGNKLSGSIPEILIEKSRNGSLTLRVGGNPNICISDPCHKRNKLIIPLVVTLGGAVTILAMALFIFRRLLGITNLIKIGSSNSVKYKSVDSKKTEFTYSEVLSITNNFEKVVGKGGFGTVYYGCIGDVQVAVKMLSSSAQGYQQFQAEANILTRVHHKCLTPLIGYCNEDSKTALIYEYMVNGNLAEHLSDKSQNLLGWRKRLQMALDTALGLEYLHDGCKPPIIHRDVKSTNILLNERFCAKISDFGLSRMFPSESDTHISTVIAGTPGYLDPEYYITNRLNEKSDVFSFGVVLLEIITGRPAISKTNVRTHIIEWVSSSLAEGDYDSVVDSRLLGKYDTESARKAIDIAMACVAPVSVNRPTMSHVVMELMQCLPIETSRNSSSGLTEIVSIEEISGQSSLAR